MTNCEISFQYNQQKILIQCTKNELMKDIIGRYVVLSGLSLNKFDFFYNEKKINPELALSQVNDKEE